MNTDKAPQDPPERPPSSSARNIAVAGHQIDSQQIFVGTREVTIVHGDDTYRLRLTAQNKLILTK